jgi:hypothetical protein
MVGEVVAVVALSLFFFVLFLFLFSGVWQGRGYCQKRNSIEWLLLEGKREPATAQRGLFGWGEVEEGAVRRVSFAFSLVPRNKERNEPH